MMRWMTCAGVALLLAGLHAEAADRAGNPIRVTWCTYTPNQHTMCNFMKNDVGEKLQLSIDCILESSAYGCMRQIHNKTADVVVTSAEDTYIAMKDYDLAVYVRESFQGIGSSAKYRSIALIKRDGTDTYGINRIQDLSGKKSCHGNLEEPTSLFIPYVRMLQQGLISQQSGSCDDVFNNTDSFFSDSCAPGYWSNDKAWKDAHPTMCSLCPGGCGINAKNPIQCLKNDGGDVAFTTDVNALTNIQRSERQKYAVLCPHRRTLSVEDQVEWKPLDENGISKCFWAMIQGNHILGRKDHEARLDLKRELAQIGNLLGPTVNNQWKGLIVSPSIIQTTSQEQVNSLLSLEELSNEKGNDYKQVFKEIEGYEEDAFLWSMDFQNFPGGSRCPVQPLRWCVLSGPEEDKCNDMKYAYQAKRLRPLIQCGTATDYYECMAGVASGSHDVTMLNAGYMLEAGTYGATEIQQLQPFVGERYGGGSSTGSMDRAYAVVGVIKSAGQTERYKNIFHLRGLKSCHAFYQDGASWTVAPHRLMDMSQVRIYSCHVADGLGNFFTGGSCVPGSSRSGSSLSDRLCSQCSTGPYRCKMDHRENYFGHVGAFRCLVEERGDIAFLPHWTVEQNTNANNKDEWALNLRSDQYKLVCLDGSLKNIGEWAQCNFGYVPANHLMVKMSTFRNMRVRVWRMLDAAQRLFGSELMNPNSYEDASFHMFNSKWMSSDLVGNRNFSNLIFNDYVHKLEHLPWNTSYEDVLKPVGDTTHFLRMSKQSDRRPNRCWYRNNRASSDLGGGSPGLAFAAALATATTLHMLRLFAR